MPKRVLHILGTAGQHGAGIAHLVRGLARGLDPQRYRIHALFLAGDGPLVSVLQQAGAQVSAVDWVRGARDPMGAWRFWRHLRNQQFDIVHVHFGGRSVFWLARAATGAKIVLHLWDRILEPRGLTPVYFSARGTDGVVAASQAIAS